MTFNEYQKLAMRTLNTKSVKHEKDLLNNAALGLSGEVGEFNDHIKKHIFQNHELDNEKLILELGDILWYIAEAAEGLNTTMAVIAERNIAKLKKRYPEGFTTEKSINREK